MSDKDFVQYLVFGSDLDSGLAYEILKKVVSCHLFSNYRLHVWLYVFLGGRNVFS